MAAVSTKGVVGVTHWKQLPRGTWTALITIYGQGRQWPGSFGLVNTFARQKQGVFPLR